MFRHDALNLATYQILISIRAIQQEAAEKNGFFSGKTQAQANEASLLLSELAHNWPDLLQRNEENIFYASYISKCDELIQKKYNRLISWNTVAKTALYRIKEIFEHANTQ